MEVPLSQLPNPPNTSALLGMLHGAYARTDGGPRSVSIDSQSVLILDGLASAEMIELAWQHAYRRSEDEMIFILPTNSAALSPFISAVSVMPGVDGKVLQALSLVESFVHAQTPENLRMPFHNGLRVAFSLNAQGAIVSTRISLAEQPLNSLAPLVSLPPKPGYRSFDAFYHLLYSQRDRAEVLSLKAHPYQYDLLKPSNTFTLPNWVQDADDYALAKDWYDAMLECFPKDFRRSVMEALSGILLLGNEDASDQADGAMLIGIEGKYKNDYPAHELVSASYVNLLQAVVAKVNEYLATLDLQERYDSPGHDNMNSIAAVVKIIEGTVENRAEVLEYVFDNGTGINAEMVADGISLPKTPSSITKTVKRLNTGLPPPMLTTIEDFTALMHPSVSWPSVAAASMPKTDEDLFGNPNVFRLSTEKDCSRVWVQLALATDTDPRNVAAQQWDTSLVSEQIREFYITEWAAKRGPVDFTADFGLGEFVEWYRLILPSGPGGLQLESWAQQRGFGGRDFFYGRNRIYLSEPVYQELENELLNAQGGAPAFANFPAPFAAPHFPHNNPAGANPFGAGASLYSFGAPGNDRRSLVPTFPATQNSTAPSRMSSQGFDLQRGLRPQSFEHEIYDREGNVRQVEEELGGSGYYNDEDDEVFDDERAYLQNDWNEKDGRHLEVYRMTRGRRAWVTLVWLLTWWIPSPFLKWFGRMKRGDVRMAWREKVVIFFFIFLINAGIIFYMIFLGHFICPDYDKVWNHKQLSTHQGVSDFYVGIRGYVYDITKFYKIQHSDNGVDATPDRMLEFAGQDITDYFTPPLYIACPSLVTDQSVSLTYNETLSPLMAIANHASGTYLVPNTNTALHNDTWYQDVFEPKINEYMKGDIVEKPKDVEKIANNENRYLFMIDKKIYDVTNYMLTIQKFPTSQSVLYQKYSFFPSAVESMFRNYQGLDATDQWNKFDESTRTRSMECLENVFYYGKYDFRDSAKCQASNVILLVIAGILTSITLVKFLASIRFSAKPIPSPQDRHVICQIPAYTESENELRLAIDSLTGLDYDHRRKLLVVICDGLVVGAGNDLPTPEIVLDIFGHLDRSSAEPKEYHAIAEGARELNYAKVYSGIYENEGNTVPYLVIVKVGSSEEQDAGNSPGNRGKRDSQIVLMNFLNRVHYQKPMCPLDLEIFHHMNNIIGVDPERYDYLFTVDADTRVRPDSLTRLVAACTNDNSIAAVCGETSIENEQQSLSTMIQVYEYFISHHLTKAFESLFGSVTCLPGCFSLYRLRTARRFKPLLISDEVIHEYSLRHVDTLHKKNLFSLGEDRYLTTLMAKHFPRMKLKFVADARCQTQVPSDFSVLLSQRRRWINSTVHNLVELLRLDTMCGFFLFNMRGVVFVDLLGTLMLPSVVVYLVYLIYVIASHTSPLPIISIVLIGVVYGLQTAVYIMHRRWQHIFWMIVYLIAYPFHSFLLPIYSFWNMDNFSWGNTRMVEKEADGKRIILQNNDDMFDPRSVPYMSWAEFAHINGLEGEQREILFDDRQGRIVQRQNVFDMASVIDPEKSTKAMSVYSRALTNNFSDKVFDAGTEAQIRSTVKQVLAATDLDTMTPRQLRDKVGDLLGVEFDRERAIAVDQIIDEELELLDDEDDEDMSGVFEAPPLPQHHSDNGPFDAQPETPYMESDERQ